MSISHPCWGSRSQKVNSGLAVAAQDFTAQLSGVGRDSEPEPGAPAPRLKVWELKEVMVWWTSRHVCGVHIRVFASVYFCLDESVVWCTCFDYLLSECTYATLQEKQYDVMWWCNVMMIAMELIRAKNWSEELFFSMKKSLIGPNDKNDPIRPDRADGVEDDRSKNIDDKRRVSGELYVHWVRVLHLGTPKLEIVS